MVLLAASKYCKTKLDSWSPADTQPPPQAPPARTGLLAGLMHSWKSLLFQPTSSVAHAQPPNCKLELRLPVPAGQQELAELLVKGMYQAQPSITDGLSQQQLLQLMMLADRFEVPKVMAAVAAACAAVAEEQIEWNVALQILSLQPSCTQQTEFLVLQDLALQQLLLQLGDLEEVWAQEQLQQQLLRLPFDALHQLLQHPDTRVASENTVVYTIERWYSAQDEQQQHVQQLQQLMHLVRMQHCTSYFAGTVMPQSSLVQQCFELPEQLLMRECCTEGGLSVLKKADSPALTKYPAWSAGQRPVSSREPVINWHIPLSEIRAAVEQLLSKAQGTTAPISTPCAPVVESNTYVVMGQQMRLLVEVNEGVKNGIDIVTSATDDKDSNSNNGDNSSAVLLQLGLFVGVRPLDLPSNAIRMLSAELSIVVNTAALMDGRLAAAAAAARTSPEAAAAAANAALAAARTARAAAAAREATTPAAAGEESEEDDTDDTLSEADDAAPAAASPFPDIVGTIAEQPMSIAVVDVGFDMITLGMVRNWEEAAACTGRGSCMLWATIMQKHYT